MASCRLRLTSAAFGLAVLLGACDGPAAPPDVQLGPPVVGRVVTSSGEPAAGISLFIRRVEALQDTLMGRCSRTTVTGEDGLAVFAAADGGYRSEQPWGEYCVHLYGIRDGVPVRLSDVAVEVYYANAPDTLNGRLPAGPGRWERERGAAVEMP